MLEIFHLTLFFVLPPKKRRKAEAGKKKVRIASQQIDAISIEHFLVSLDGKRY